MQADGAMSGHGVTTASKQVNMGVERRDTVKSGRSKIDCDDDDEDIFALSKSSWNPAASRLMPEVASLGDSISRGANDPCNDSLAFSASGVSAFSRSKSMTKTGSRLRKSSLKKSGTSSMAGAPDRSSSMKRKNRLPGETVVDF